MDAVADNKDTLMEMIHDLHKNYVIKRNLQWLVVEGDVKVYKILKSLKTEYGAELEWLLSYPGDWHLLKTTRLH